MHRNLLTCLSVIVFLAQAALSQAAQGPKKISKDEAFRAIAAQVITKSESPLTNVIGAIDEVIEIGEVSIDPKTNASVVTVKEKAESNKMATNKSTQLVFVRLPDGSWKWDQFKNDTRFYPIDKLYPYAKDELTRRRDAIGLVWNRYIVGVKATSDAALKALDTAKAVLKKDLEITASVKNAQAAFLKSLGGNDYDLMKTTRDDLLKALEPMSKVADENQDLKANDAFLRLIEAYEASRKSIDNTLKDYFTGIEIYNDKIQRLPFSLVAFGFGFLKADPMVPQDQ